VKKSQPTALGRLLTAGQIKEHAAEKGRVYWGLTFRKIFSRLDLAPDFKWEAKSADAESLTSSGRIGDADLYFVSNQKLRVEPITARFRVTERQPELWDPVMGAVTRPAIFKATPSGLEMKSCARSGWLRVRDFPRPDAGTARRRGKWRAGFSLG